jgi:hypothetical protein
VDAFEILINLRTRNMRSANEGSSPNWSAKRFRRRAATGRLCATGTQRPEMTLFRAFRRHFPRQTSVVIEICSAPRSPYSAGDGCAAIFRSMLTKSRRARLFLGRSRFR